MNLKNIWRKIIGEKAFSGISIDNTHIKILKLVKQNDNFLPIYWNEVVFTLSEENTKNINFFKKLKEKINDETVSIDIESKNIEEIISFMKIAGFKNIKTSSSKINMNMLFTDTKSKEKTAFILILDTKIYINYTDNSGIYKQEDFLRAEFNEKKIKEISEEVEHRQIFLSGNYNFIKENYITEFYNNNLELEIFNPWKNICDFKYIIPEMFKEDSHRYMELISLTLPELPKIDINIKDLKDTSFSKDERGGEKKEKLDLNFIKNKTKQENEIIFEKELFWKNTWNSFKEEWDGSVFAVFWKFKKEKNKKDKKIFLLKPKLKLFLPKSLKNKKISKKKVKKEKSPKTKKSKDKHKKTKRKTISKKKK